MISVVIAISRLAALHPFDAAHIFVARVEPLHRAQHASSSRTAPADARDCRAPGLRVDRVDDALHEIARMGRREAHAADAGTSRRRSPAAAQNPSRGRRIAIAVHVLAKKLHFGIAGIAPADCASRSTLSLRAAALRPARKRHHAIGAALIAALDDRDVRAMRIVAPGERRVEGLVRIEAQPGNAAVARPRAAPAFRAASCSWPSRPPGSRAEPSRKCFSPSCCATQPRTPKTFALARLAS